VFVVEKSLKKNKNTLQVKTIRKWTYLLIGIIIASLFIKIIDLGGPSIRGDEGFSVYLAKLPFQESWNVIINDVHPPGYYFLLRGWISLGDSEFMLRFLSVLLSLAAIPVIFLLGKKLFNERVGILAASILAFSQVHLRYSQNIRMYSFVTLLALLAAYYFVSFIRSGKTKDVVLYGMFSLLGLYSHYYFAFLLIAMNLFIFIERPSHLKKWFLFSGCIAILCIPLLLMAYGQYSLVGSVNEIFSTDKVGFFNLDESNVFLRGAMIFFHFGAGFLKANFHNLIFIAIFLIAVALFVVLFILAFKKSWLKKSSRKNFYFLLFCAALPMIILVFLWGTGILWPQTYERHILIISPFYFLILAIGLGELKKKMLFGAMCIFLVLNAISAYNYYLEAYSKEDWKDMVLMMPRNDALPMNDALFFLSPESYRYNLMYYETSQSPIIGTSLGKDLRDTSILHSEILMTMRPMNSSNVCAFVPLAKNYSHVFFVQMRLEGREKDIALQMKCLESSFAIVSTKENVWKNIWGDTGKDIVIIEYQRKL
jgi:4-amino-4-deoxy-L-arabinose transferase-like glycosyltransferase